MRVTEAEAFLVYRRRRSLTQDKAAKRHGVRSYVVVKWESGELSIPVKHRQKIGVIKPHEKCYLMRRRNGWSQDFLANKMRRCRAWVALMEAGSVPHTELRKFWKV